MLPRKNRLPLRKEPDFFRTANFYKDKGFLLYWKHSVQPIFRIAIVVPKTRISKATERNKVKRELTGWLGSLHIARSIPNVDAALIFLSSKKTYQEARRIAVALPSLLQSLVEKSRT